MNDATTTKSRAGCIITYTTCPSLWISKLQTLVTYLTSEVEYAALNTAFMKVIVVMNVLKEIE
eukprot:5232423-Ditylum_brightwellii.AAC.1